MDDPEAQRMGIFSEASFDQLAIPDTQCTTTTDGRQE